MNFRLKHQFRLESARFLPKLPQGHPCRQVHGHSFLVTLHLKSQDLHPELEWMIDFNDLKKLADPLMKSLDHKLLNEVPGLTNPTSENLAEFIFKKLKPTVAFLERVSIQETPETECSYGAD